MAKSTPRHQKGKFNPVLPQEHEFDKRAHLIAHDDFPAEVDSVVGAGSIAVKVRKTAATSVATATGTVLSWNIEDYDAAGYFPGSSENLVIPQGHQGNFLAVAGGVWTSNATGIRQMRIQKGTGGTFDGSEWALDIRPAVNGAVTSHAFFVPVILNAGDAVRVWVYQDSGGALNFNSATVEYGVFFGLVRS